MTGLIAHVVLFAVLAGFGLLGVFALWRLFLWFVRQMGRAWRS